MRPPVPLLLLLLLAGCTGRFDSDQQRLCRLAIPALNAPGTPIAIERSGQGPRPALLRIAYVAGAGPTARRRTIDCLFAGAGETVGRARLAGIASDGVPMGEASFYLLRRFYLEDAADPPRDPAARSGAGLPVLPPALGYGVQQALAGLPKAAIYALAACAYALIYGLTGRIILSFGEFAAVGALAGVVGVAAVMALALATPASGLAVAIAVGTAAAALHGFATGRFVLAPLRRASGQQVLIATAGLSIALSEYLRLAQGPQLRWLPPAFNEPLALARSGAFLVTASPIGLALTGLGLGCGLALVLFIRRSAYGRAWRAVADDAGTAALFGVDARRVHDVALALGAAACGLAGVIMTIVHGGMGFADGFGLGLKALAAAVLGGIGSVSGAFLGGICIALFEMLWSALMPIEQRDIAVYAVLAAMLALRPGGFFGEAHRLPRRV